MNKFFSPQTYLGWILLLFLSGCATMPYGSNRDRYEAEKTFYLQLTSDPPGATVIQKRNGQNIVLGTTPVLIPFHFVKERGDDFLGQLGMKSWQHKDPRRSPWRLYPVEGQKKFRLSLRRIELERDGYEAEDFEFDWLLAKDFNVRNVLGDVIGEEAVRREATVVLKNPVKPEFYRTLQLQGAAPGMEAYRLEEGQRKGLRIGQLPVSIRVGFARDRNREGKILNWKWWRPKDDLEFLHFNEKGILSLTAWLEAPDFDVDALQNFTVLNLNESQSEVVSKTLRMTTPQKPQSTFILKVDSLPTDAEIYEVLKDGTLGGKAGTTPLEMQIGLGQKLRPDDQGNYLHDDWLVWMPNQLVAWEKDEEGATRFFLSCGLFREGFAMERVQQEIFRLVPGQALPTSRTLTIPLLHPEQAAVRDASRMQPRVAPAPTPIPARQPFIWKEPDPTQLPPPREEEKKPFWKRFRSK